MTKFFKKLWRDEEGATMVEYALLVGLISIIAIVAITAAGGSVNAIFTKVAAALGTAD